MTLRLSPDLAEWLQSLADKVGLSRTLLQEKWLGVLRDVMEQLEADMKDSKLDSELAFDTLGRTLAVRMVELGLADETFREGWKMISAREAEELAAFRAMKKKKGV